MKSTKEIKIDIANLIDDLKTYLTVPTTTKERKEKRQKEAKLKRLRECVNLVNNGVTATHCESEIKRLKHKLVLINKQWVADSLGMSDDGLVKKAKRQFEAKQEVPLIKEQIQSLTYLTSK